MLLAQGFLRRIFEVFELYKTSIDMITTSEVAVSLTIDDCTHIEGILESLRGFGHAEVDNDMSIVCIVGEQLAENNSTAFNVISALEDISIRMISFGGSEHNISLLVADKDKSKVLNLLNERLFDV